MPNYSAGGAFLPNYDIQFSGQVNTLFPFVTLPFTSGDITATGTTGTTATALPAGYPAVVTVTGASGAGVALQTGSAVTGAFYLVKNMMTGALNIYAVGGTIDGTTGTTALALTATGNKTIIIFCTVAGAWRTAFAT